MKKRIIVCILCVLIMSGVRVEAASTGFLDVPAGSWAKDAIAQVSALGIMTGPGDGTFGYGKNLTRAEFAAMLMRLFNWSLTSPEVPTFKDNTDKGAWYYDDVETIVLNGAVADDVTLFRPNDPITREELAVMLVRGLGYAPLADSLRNIRTPFTDVTDNLTYIAMAYDFGIINGITEGDIVTFQPDGTATREAAAAMMSRLYNRFYSKVAWSHAFYAISSYAQKDMLPDFDAISFGWSRLEVDAAGSPLLNMTGANGNTFKVPTGYEEVVQLAKTGAVPDNLSVYMSTSQKVTLPDGTASNACRAVLTDAAARSGAVALIVAELVREGNYTGVTIDFEEMKGEDLKNGLNLFLQELRAELTSLGLSLYVCVPPATSDGVYYDGYDYKTIGDCADKVILMAHDYAATTLTPAEMNAGYTATPVSPIYEIYTALQAITDPETGVSDKSKLTLAISFNSIQWKLRDNIVIRASAYQPESSSIYTRLLDPTAVLNYSVKYQNPYVTYQNSADNTDNIIWYEDMRSVDAKMDLARMFGVTGISFWRLGLIPDFGDTPDRQVYYDIPAWLADQK